jgi:hypothetical protein
MLGAAAAGGVMSVLRTQPMVKNAAAEQQDFMSVFPP